MKRLAPCFVQVIRCGAHILAGAAPGHALKHQALIRPDYPGRRVVRQYLVLETRNFVLNSKQRWLALERVFKLCVGCMFVRMCDRWGLRDVATLVYFNKRRKMALLLFLFLLFVFFLFPCGFFFFVLPERRTLLTVNRHLSASAWQLDFRSISFLVRARTNARFRIAISFLVTWFAPVAIN